jgi:hypothetical protein
MVVADQPEAAFQSTYHHEIAEYQHNCMLNARLPGISANPMKAGTHAVAFSGKAILKVSSL